MAICIAEDGGSMTVGGFNSTVHRKSRTSASSKLRLLSISQTLRLDMQTRETLFRRRLATEKAVAEREQAPLRKLLEKHQYNKRRRKLQGQDFGIAVNEAREVKTDEGLDSVEGASIQIAWTPITSTSAYNIQIIEMKALLADNKEIVVGKNYDFGSSVVVDSGMRLEKSCQINDFSFFLSLFRHYVFILPSPSLSILHASPGEFVCAGDRLVLLVSKHEGHFIVLAN